MPQADDSYAQFHASIGEILQLNAQSRAGFAELNLSNWTDACDRIERRLKNESFRVIILGEFKRGKSTFINALLGKEVLPAFATPCTAIINEVKWGPEPKAVLHFRDPLPSQLPKGLSKEVLKYLNKHAGNKVPPVQIPVDQLEQYVAIPDPAKDQAASIAETPYDHVELFWPLPLLQNRVDIIDSPGLNEHGSRTKVTMDYLGKIDAVVFLLSVHALASQSELAVIDQDVRAAGHEHIFFVCNRFDELRKQADRNSVVNYAYERLAPRTTMAREGIFFISALDALCGREDSDAALLERSKVPEVETALAKFLVNERGRIKLLQPARLLSQGLKTALFSAIPDQRKMYHGNIAELEQRYVAAQPRLVEADHKRREIISKLEYSRERLRDKVLDASLAFLRNVAASVPMWATQVDVSSKVSVIKFWELKKQVSALAEEVVKGISCRVEEASAEWRDNLLKPMIDETATKMEDTTKDSVRDFMANLEKIKEELSQNLIPSAEGITPEHQLVVSDHSTITANASIELMSGGFGRIIQMLAPTIAVTVFGVLVLHLNPITLVATILGAGLLNLFSVADFISGRAKTAVGKEVANQLLRTTAEQSKKMSDRVYLETAPMIEQIDAVLSGEVQSIREQVEAVLATKQAGVEEVNRQLERLAYIEARLQETEGEVADFIAQLAHGRS